MWKREAVSDGELFINDDYFHVIHHEYFPDESRYETSRFFVRFNGESHKFNSFSDAENAISQFEK